MSECGGNPDSRTSSQNMVTNFNTHHINVSNNHSSIGPGSSNGMNNMGTAAVTAGAAASGASTATTSYTANLTQSLGFEKSHQSPLYHSYSVENLHVSPYQPTNMRPLPQSMRPSATTMSNGNMINIPYQYDLNKSSQSLSKGSSSSSLPAIQPSAYLNNNVLSSYSQPHRLPSMNQQISQNVQQNNILQHQNVLVDNQNFIESSKYNNSNNNNNNNNLNNNSNVVPQNPKLQQITFNQYPQEPEYYGTNIKQLQQQKSLQQQQQQQQQQQSHPQLQIPPQTQGQPQINIGQQLYPVQMDAGPQMEYYRSPSVNVNAAQNNQINKPFSMIDAGNNRGVKLDYTKVDRLAYEISQNMIVPPFNNLKPSKASMKSQKPKRSKRRSKFTKEQDMIIINMKKENKTWVEIAECAKVDSYLAARNRYQVLIGQQGGGTSECGPEDVLVLREIVDDGEIEKMKYLSKEFRKCTGKLCSYKQVRELIRYLFWKNAGKFDVNPNYLHELERLQKLRYEELRGEGREDGKNGGNEDDAYDNKKKSSNEDNNDIEAIVKKEKVDKSTGAANHKVDNTLNKQR